MLKFKNAIARCTSNNKGNASKLISSILLASRLNQTNESMVVQLEELTDLEKTQYNTWWFDLNPSDANELNNIKTLAFLSKFNLSEEKLEEIISLFRNQKKGLKKEQFFAVLRLIGHAQNGKRINPAYIRIAGPIPLLPIRTAIDSETTSRPSFETVSSYNSTINSPISPFDDGFEMDNDHHRPKAFPFMYHDDHLDRTDELYSMGEQQHHTLLLTQPFKPKFNGNNNYPNSYQVPPPPVPPQSTKPAFPKYAKRMSK